MRVTLLALALPVFACTQTPSAPASEESSAPTEPTTPTPTALPFRLVDHVDAARIESPLATVTATSALEDSVKTETVVDLTFDGMPPALPGAGCRIGLRPDRRGKALIYGGSKPHTCIFVLPAEPSSHYRFLRAVRTEDPNIDFQVIESRVRLKHPQTLNHPADIDAIMNGKFVSMQQLLTVHHFGRPQRSLWDAASVNVFTSPYTRSVVILLNDAEGLIAGRTRKSYFDDIRVEKLTPSAAEELALLKRADPLPGAGDSGFAKQGQLLPVGLLSEVKAPYDTNYDYREALFAPSPSTLRYRLVELPKTATLDFAYGLHKAARRGDTVTFRVAGEKADGGREVLFEETVRVEKTGPGWRWRDATISLETLAGGETELVLETVSAPGQRGYGLWAAPVIVDKPAPEKPNVIFIAIDTLRADRLSSYGHERLTSPTIDRIAKDGVLFERAVSGSNWTSPSFASLFTGRTPSRHQVVHRARSIPLELTTLPEYFRAAGYITEAVMYKAYLYNMGFEQGFDRWFNVPLHDVNAQSNLDHAMSWLERNKDRTFFLFLHFNDPHQPFNQPDAWASKFTSKPELASFDLNLPIVITGDNYVKGCSRCGNRLEEFKPVGKELYDAEVAYIDNRLGVFIDALKEKGLYDNTIIAVVADHGEMMWEHANTFGHGGPWLFDTLTRVPLIIKPHKGSGLAKAQRVQRTVQAYDLMPTLVELAGLELDDQERNGQSLLSLMNGSADGDVEGEPCFTENVKHNVTAVVHEGWKLIVNHPPNRGIRKRLYHLTADRLEQRNVLRSEPARARELERKMAEWIMVNRQGRFLVFSPGRAADQSSLTLRTDRPFRRARALFGAEGRAANSKTLTVAANPGAELVFIEIDAADELTYELEITSTAPLVSTRVKENEVGGYELGTIDGMIARDSPTVAIYRGAPPVVQRETKAMNAQRLEALRALGYIQ